jgi:threonine synthase
MQFYSTKNKKHIVTLKEAVLKGMPDDGGLYLPVELPQVQPETLNELNSKTFLEIAFEVLRNLLKDSLPETIMENIINDAFDFSLPLIRLDEKISALELFHGPTFAFKDFAARFMARLMAYFVKDSNRELTILTATSGDTGSAVADGFHKMDGINVIILYPSGMVSSLQEKQLTTVGDNITALEIKGTFDDCQNLVKQAFVDPDLPAKLNLTSANSINIARLIPQSLYYFYAYAQIFTKNSSLIMSVPCGNFGNLTAGIMAKKMGLPISKFIASVNQNDSFVNYLNTGIFKPVKTKKTISNAMDVGNPSNFRRILDLYNYNVEAIRQDIASFSFNDEQTKEAINEVYQKYQYILDPHGAVGYLGIKKFMKNYSSDEEGIFLETAHPGKFIDIVQECITEEIELPKSLTECLSKEKSSTVLSKEYNDFKQFLYNLS